MDTAVTGGERAYRPLTRSESNAKRGLFTADSFQAALEVADYARYVETVVRPLETAPGCGRCQPNRLRLERAWQTTANEALYLDQQKWAQQLKRTLVEAGGVIRDEAQLQAALASLLSAVGDEYSAYLSPPAWERALRRPTGPAQQRYDAALATGVGLQLERGGAAGEWRVAAPGADGPAEAAGVRRGDALLAVDGVSVTGRSEEEVEASLRGPEGSTVTLLLQPRRGSAAQPRSLALERRLLLRPPASVRLVELPGGHLVMAIRIRLFTSESTRLVAASLRAGEALGVDGYTFDLRNCPGGVLEEAITSAELMLPCGRVIAQTRRGGAEIRERRWIDTQ